MTQFGIGQSVSRFEDPRLLRGQGQFVDDQNLAGQAHAVLVRSPHAHARINSIDTRAAPGGFWRSTPGTWAPPTAWAP
jgi:carbon-monoxide dehydrogenase large subunit